MIASTAVSVGSPISMAISGLANTLLITMVWSSAKKKLIPKRTIAPTARATANGHFATLSNNVVEIFMASLLVGYDAPRYLLAQSSITGTGLYSLVPPELSATSPDSVVAGEVAAAMPGRSPATGIQSNIRTRIACGTNCWCC
jgi:hypothetical protein